MSASRIAEVGEQPARRKRKVSVLRAYPLLGLGLILATAAGFYGALFYFFVRR